MIVLLVVVLVLVLVAVAVLVGNISHSRSWRQLVLLPEIDLDAFVLVGATLQ